MRNTTSSPYKPKLFQKEFTDTDMTGDGVAESLYYDICGLSRVTDDGSVDSNCEIFVGGS